MSGKKLVIGILLVALVISAWAAKTILEMRKKVGHTASASAALPAEQVTPSGAMRLVPYGFTQVDEDRLPMQLPAFYLDRTEVTNEMYARLAQTTGAPALPVVNVTFDQAKAYCEAQGKRLPQPQEWEKAARGENGARWPWGEADPKEQANIANPSGALEPAGSRPQGASPYGILDLTGNVWEWVDDPQTPKSRHLETLARLLSPPPQKGERWYAARGGAFDTSVSESLPYKYLVLPARYKAGNLGFRCAKSAAIQ